jgi:tetratricopeptide (TPR) repeat protein
MRVFGMRIAGALAGCLLASVAVGRPLRTQAQAAAVGSASIHGHVTNPAGQPVNAGTVQLTTDKNPNSPSRKFEYTFVLDQNGNYKGSDIKPATYIAVVMQGTKTVDFLPAAVAAGEDKTLDFDMTRKEYMDKMSPADREALEEYKKKNAEVVAANSKIENLNALLKQARADKDAGNFDAAAKAMTDATTAKPDEPILWDTLGDAQLGQADAAAKAAKAAHATDASVPDKYGAAVTSYQKALTLNAASAKPSADITATANNQLGQALGKLAMNGQPGKVKDAAAAYEAAAKADPPKAGMYYFNEAATLFNAGDGDDAAAAADKAITADPAKAQAYYIKGQALIQKASVDEKTQKVTVPPGCVEAYQKYLELAPDGPQAEEVKNILTGIGQPIKSTFKAGKKS